MSRTLGRLRQQDLAVSLRAAWDLIRKEERDEERGEEEDSIVVGRHKSKGSLECRSSLGGRPTFIGQKTSLNWPQSTLKA